MKRILFVGAGCVLLTGLFLACTTQNVAERKAQAEATRNLGEAYLRQGKYRAALKELKKAAYILFPVLPITTLWANLETTGMAKLSKINVLRY